MAGQGNQISDRLAKTSRGTTNTIETPANSRFRRHLTSCSVLALIAGLALAGAPNPAEAFVCQSTAGGGGGAQDSGNGFSTACGNAADATGVTVNGTSTTNNAFGQQANASGNDSRNVAIGSATEAQGTGSGNTALGAFSRAFGDASHNTAIGHRADANGDSASNVAIGYLSVATGGAGRSVALGSYSIADRDDTVSVGQVGLQRQITNVAAGTMGTDAVNLNQLNAAVAGANPAFASTNQAAAPNAAAGGQNATGVGYGASAGANNSVALGNGSVANQANTVSVGAVGAERRIVNVDDGTIAAGSHDAVNGGQVFALAEYTDANLTALQNGQAGAFRDNNTSGAAAPQASGADAVAGGFGSVASAAQTVAIGHNAQATSAGATAVGYGSVASGDPTTAVGMMASATGNEASAFGASATASADNATALGRSATASAANAVAVGAFSTAAQANSVAIGTNVSTTRANQIAIGNATQTYTLAGVSSAQSLAAQTGPTRFVTTDASGNLATSSFDPASVTALDGRVSALEAGYGQIRRDVRSAFAGTAIALALSGAVLPPGKNYALTGGFGTFRGQTAFGASGVARINDNLYASGGVGFATTGSSNVGARASLTYAW